MGTYRGLALAVPQRNTSTLVCIFWRPADLYVSVQTTVAPAPINEVWHVTGAWWFVCRSSHCLIGLYGQSKGCSMIHPIFTPARERTNLSLVPRTPASWATPAAEPAPQGDMLQALSRQLRRAVSAVPQRASDLADNPENAAIRLSLLACADALDGFEAAADQDCEQRRRLESQISLMQAELRQTRDKLARTRVEERDARDLALHDSLTALPNRRYFAQRLTEALGDAAPRRQPLAVLFLDLDDFKPVNDAHGHATGEKMLKIIACRLSRTLRSADMVSRLGGDEFACLLHGLPEREQLSHMACKVIDAIAAPCKIGTLQLQVRPSIGISLFPHDGSDATALLRNADTAMYNAKRHQSGYAFFDEPLSGWTRERGAGPFPRANTAMRSMKVTDERGAGPPARQAPR